MIGITTIQVEKDLKNGNITKFNVKWISDCEYELTIAEGKKEMMFFYEGKKLDIKITDTFNDGYKFDAVLIGTNIKYTQVMKKI